MQIRQASIHDLDKISQLAANEGWNPGKKDIYPYALTDPNGFFIGTLNNEIIACIANVIYSKQFSFLGLYIVKPQHRGKGYGYQLWQHAINYAKGCNIALDGVIAQQNNYRKSGFSLSHRNIRFCLEENTIHSITDPRILDAHSVPISMILNYQEKFFPARRDPFATQWLLQYEGLVFYDNGIQGYGVIRPAETGFRIGPLFAENEKIALLLFQALCMKAPNKTPIYLDIPEPNKNAIILTEYFKMKPIFETARMYTKQAPEIALSKTFGVTTFEVG